MHFTKMTKMTGLALVSFCVVLWVASTVSLFAQEGEGLEGARNESATRMAATEPVGSVPEDIMARGAATYVTYCAACHGEAGSGIGEAPSLVNNTRLQDEVMVITQILAGQGYMPGFATFIPDDAEVAALVTYIRNTWQNSYGLVTEEQVETERL